MFDRRFPNLMRMNGPLPGLRGDRAGEARRIAAAIQSRTGRKVAWDRNRAALYVYLGDNSVDSGVALFPLDHPIGGKGPFGEADIDDMVRFINYGKMSRKQKDRLDADREAAVRADENNFIGERFEDSRRDTEDRLTHIADKRTMGKHWKGSAVVNGSKGV